MKVVRWFLKKWKSFAGLALLGVLGAFILIWHANRVALQASEERLFSEAGEVPETPVALVFGCSKVFQGRQNLYFKHRIKACLLYTSPSPRDRG